MDELNTTDLTSGSLVHMQISPEDRTALARAFVRLRQSRGVIVRSADLLVSVIGPAASLGLRQLSVPKAYLGKARGLAEAALRRAFDVAVIGVGAPRGRFPKLDDRTGKVVAATSGLISGFIGFAGFLPDLTINTMLIMRRIAAIAKEEGEDLSTEEARAACLQVFALDPAHLDSAPGGMAESDPELAYWTARIVLQGRPLMLLLSEVAASYGVRISQKFALQAVPLVGAAGAAIVNSVFLDHYQSLARAHFVIRRLERTYGSATIRAEWARGPARAAA